MDKNNMNKILFSDAIEQLDLSVPEFIKLLFDYEVDFYFTKLEFEYEPEFSDDLISKYLRIEPKACGYIKDLKVLFSNKFLKVILSNRELNIDSKINLPFALLSDENNRNQFQLSLNDSLKDKFIYLIESVTEESQSEKICLISQHLDLNSTGERKECIDALSKNEMFKIDPVNIVQSYDRNNFLINHNENKSDLRVIFLQPDTKQSSRPIYISSIYFNKNTIELINKKEESRKLKDIENTVNLIKKEFEDSKKDYSRKNVIIKSTVTGEALLVEKIEIDISRDNIYIYLQGIEKPKMYFCKDIFTSHERWLVLKKLSKNKGPITEEQWKTIFPDKSIIASKRMAERAGLTMKEVLQLNHNPISVGTNKTQMKCTIRLYKNTNLDAMNRKSKNADVTKLASDFLGVSESDDY